MEQRLKHNEKCCFESKLILENMNLSFFVSFEGLFMHLFLILAHFRDTALLGV